MSFEQTGNKLIKYYGDDQEIVVPDGIEELDSHLFSNAQSLKKIILPKSLKEIKATMFPSSQWGSTSVLEEIIVDSENPLYKSVDGVLYSKDMQKLVTYPAGAQSTKFVVPETVKEINKYAFQGCNNLKTVVLPGGCLKIGEYAFNSCENLTSINLNEVDEIDNNAFSDCHKLQGAELDNINTVKEWSFHGCWKLQHVRFGKVETIESYAFAGCDIIDPVFPDSLKTIDQYGFSGKGSVEVPESVESIGECALESYKEITIYDNLRGRVSEMGKPYGNATEYSYDVFVKSAGDGALKYVIPMHSDGTYNMHTLLLRSWKKDNTFDFITLDQYFKSIKKPSVKTKLAMTRLFNPFELSDEARKTYESYLKKNATGIVEQFVDGSSGDGSFVGVQKEFSPSIKERAFELSVSWGLLKKTNIDELIEYAQKGKKTEWVAFLMDWKNKNVKKGKTDPSLKAKTYGVGDIITFGQIALGQKEVPLEWIVADTTKKQYLLLSKYLVKKMPFYSGDRKKKEYIGWSRSDARAWLNGEFLSTAFTDAERDRICLKKLKNINDTDTEDYLFIPNEKEFMNYVEIPGLLEETLQFEYGTNRALGKTEMLRKTWLRYSECCIEVRTCQIWIINNKPAYNRQSGLTDRPFWIRPMMWITKE